MSLLDENPPPQQAATTSPELAALLQAADPASREQAWSQFLDVYSRLMLHTARSLGSDHDAVMDRYAHVLEQFRADDFRRLRAYVPDGRTKFSTWLTVVARRLCVDHHRQRYGRAPADTADGPTRDTLATRRKLVDLVADEIELGRIASATSDNPEARLSQSELSRGLAAALAGLAPRDRLLLALRFEDDLPAREIAELMGFQTLFHVYRRINGVLASLRRDLDERGIREPTP